MKVLKSLKSAKLRDKDCKVRHCANARLALSHYYGCKNKDCYGCNSVKDYIKVRNQYGELHASIMIKNKCLENRKFLIGNFLSKLII